MSTFTVMSLEYDIIIIITTSSEIFQTLAVFSRKKRCLSSFLPHPQSHPTFPDLEHACCEIRELEAR